MNYKEALYWLEIKGESCSPALLKTQYRKMALKYHPDKTGNHVESTDRFRKIHEAYQYLRETNPLEDEEVTGDGDGDSNYGNMLSRFIQTVFREKFRSEAIVSRIVHQILHVGTAKLCEGLDKEAVLCMFHFLSKYRDVLHLSDGVIDYVKHLVVTKFENIEIYKLNPTIDDVLENNLYKLYVGEKLCLVPLWHTECYYDVSGCEIMVLCEPELPADVKMDEEGHLYLEKEMEVKDLLEKGSMEVCIGKKQWTIPCAQLFLKKEQYYLFHGEGISKPKQNIYDVQEKSDIVVKIILV